MFKDLSKAKGLGRVIPGINIASKTLSLYDGFNESTKMANEHKLKGKARAMSLIGGTAVDLGDMAVTAGVATVASMGAVGVTTFIVGVAPIWLTIGVGTLAAVFAAKKVSEFIDKYGIRKKAKCLIDDILKNGVNSTQKIVGTSI